MSCRCRAAPWRTFVQGLAQVHRVEASTTSSVLPLRLRSPALSTLHGQSYEDASRRARAYHSSRSLRQEAAAVATPVESETVREPLSSSSHDIEKPATRTDKAAESQAAPEKKARGRKPKEESAESTTKPKSKTNKGIAAKKTESNAHGKPKKGRPAKNAESKLSTNTRKEGPQKFTSFDAAFNGARSTEDDADDKPKKPTWAIQKAALKEKFPEGWKPMKRLSPDALAGIRALNAQFPDVYTTEALANRFEVSPEAIRRILRSKWRPSAEQEEKRQEAWFKRGISVWQKKAALGFKPPKKWRREGVTRDPSYHEWSRQVSERERQWEEEENKKYREALDSRSGKTDV